MLSVSACGIKMAGSYFTSGKENYYTRDASAADVWQGKLCKEIGLQDGATIKAGDFQTVLEARKTGCVAYDLTFSAPKGVSVLSQIGSDEARRDMETAHREAVEETLKEIERNEIYTRIKHNGKIKRIKTGRAAIAKFEHNISRACDPQRHTHAVILNNTVYDGKLYAVDGSRFYNTQKIYGAEYRARLAEKLISMGYEIEVTDKEKGLFDLAGMGDTEIFSKRRAEILRDMEERGESGAAAAQRATLRTRNKKEAVEIEELRQEWREAWGDRPLAVKKEVIETAPEVMKEAQRAAYAEAVEKLEASQYAWDRKTFEEEITKRGVSCGMTRARARELINADPALRRGKLKTPEKEPREFFSTERNIEIEASLFQNVADGRGAYHVALDHATVEKSLAEIQRAHGWTLTEQQRALVEHIAETPDNIIAIRGLAGTGKSFSLNAARETLERKGFEVMGAAPSGRAAAELAADAGMEGKTPEGFTKCGTLQKLMNEAERAAGKARPGEDYENKREWNFEGTRAPERPRVYFIDEAGMANNDTLKAFFDMAAAQRAADAEIKVVLVGDDKQLPPVGTGNFFSDVVQQRDAIRVAELTDIRRQDDPELLKAVQEAVLGEPKKALEILTDKDAIREIKTPKGRVSAITREYIGLSEKEREGAAILTARNADRVKINEAIRAALVKRGEIEQGEEYAVEVAKGKPDVARHFAKGDKIIFLQNDLRVGVRNGMQGRIEKIKGDDFTIVADNGERVKIDITQYKRIDHAYCITSHKAQGATLQHVIINMNSADRGLNTRNKFYVDISRAKTSVSLYCDNVEACGRQVQDFAKKYTSKDFSFNEKSGRFARVPTVKAPTKALAPGRQVAAAAHGIARGVASLVPPIPILKQAAEIVAKTIDTTAKALELASKPLELVKDAAIKGIEKGAKIKEREGIEHEIEL